MNRGRDRRAKWMTLIATALAGGTVFGTCEARVRNALVDGGKLFIFSLLDPSQFTPTSDGTTSGTITGGTTNRQLTN